MKLTFKLCMTGPLRLNGIHLNMCGIVFSSMYCLKKVHTYRLPPLPPLLPRCSHRLLVDLHICQQDSLTEFFTESGLEAIFFFKIILNPQPYCSNINLWIRVVFLHVFTPHWKLIIHLCDYLFSAL